MDVLKVGVIGCGAIGREHIKRLQQITGQPRCRCHGRVPRECPERC